MCSSKLERYLRGKQCVQISIVWFGHHWRVRVSWSWLEWCSSGSKCILSCPGPVPCWKNTYNAVARLNGVKSWCIWYGVEPSDFASGQGFRKLVMRLQIVLGNRNRRLNPEKLHVSTFNASQRFQGLSRTWWKHSARKVDRIWNKKRRLSENSKVSTNKAAVLEISTLQVGCDCNKA